MTRAYLDSVLKSYTNLDERLTCDVKIVESPNFEAGVVKLQDRREADSTTSEKLALSGLLLQSSGDMDDEGGDLFPNGH